MGDAVLGYKWVAQSINNILYLFKKNVASLYMATCEHINI